MAKLVRASLSKLTNAGSNPGRDVFDIWHSFQKNLQFLNAHNIFQQTFVNRGPFPLKSRVSIESVGTELYSAQTRPLWENCIWKSLIYIVKFGLLAVKGSNPWLSNLIFSLLRVFKAQITYWGICIPLKLHPRAKKLAKWKNNWMPLWATVIRNLIGQNL